MIQFLVTTSLVLHLLTFLWIVTLLQKINNQQTPAVDEEKLKREIEDLLFAYTSEMKEENQQLLEQLNKYKQESSTASSIKRSEDQVKAPEVMMSTEMKEENKRPPASKEQIEYEDYQPPALEVEETEMYEQSNTAKVLSLSKQGYSAEEIAKKLQLGKGEVELMIKFYQ
ncbi:DUF6115 domain-containing protein [Alkalihalobacterium chitinilyticum]|uniref:Swarming motility protein SwrB n=1 Tax=Alkalihalobacterium chitinilyticum TaxID=2980103 RepID=A0ABT5VBU9_9BACI|nr:hypothetical protein [Alkalihalobacterium chitinilyticum]MDE5412939.1 hypothetical protein [Alkalihalobacterium chitinilyticum]